jgi:hypothetical protein
MASSGGRRRAAATRNAVPPVENHVEHDSIVLETQFDRARTAFSSCMKRDECGHVGNVPHVFQQAASAVPLVQTPHATDENPG